MDFAIGANVRPNNCYDSGVLRGLGEVTYVFRNPADRGEAIQKSGARTGVTGGRTIGRTTIFAAGHADPTHSPATRNYRGVYETTPNFGDHGDSGSIVAATNLDVLGMYAWGDDHSKNGYFFTFGSQYPFELVVSRNPPTLT
jgi:hypothetical protein